MRARIIFVFIQKGVLYWLLVGALAGMICFKTVQGREEVMKDEKAKKAMSHEFGINLRNSLLIWGASGAVLGLGAFVIFSTRPSYEHGTVLPQVMPMPFMGMDPGGPRTLAESKSTFLVVILAVIIGIVAAYVALPAVTSPGTIILNTNPLPRVFIIFQGAFFSVMIIPDSLKKLARMHHEGVI